MRSRSRRNPGPGRFAQSKFVYASLLNSSRREVVSSSEGRIRRGSSGLREQRGTTSAEPIAGAPKASHSQCFATCWHRAGGTRTPPDAGSKAGAFGWRLAKRFRREAIISFLQPDITGAGCIARMVRDGSRIGSVRSWSGERGEGGLRFKVTPAVSAPEQLWCGEPPAFFRMVPWEPPCKCGGARIGGLGSCKIPRSRAQSEVVHVVATSRVFRPEGLSPMRRARSCAAWLCEVPEIASTLQAVHASRDSGVFRPEGLFRQFRTRSKAALGSVRSPIF